MIVCQLNVDPSRCPYPDCSCDDVNLYVRSTPVDEPDGYQPAELPEVWEALPAALPHVELNTRGRRPMDCDLPGWDPWCDEDGRPLPVDP